MKILDEIMALDRAGTPVKYRDLLPVVEAVRELEGDLERAARAHQQIEQRVVLEVKVLTAQHYAALDLLVRARMMMALAPFGVLPGLDHLTQAFEKWETAYRAGETMSVEEAAQMTVQEAAASNAEHFLKLLAEVQP